MRKYLWHGSDAPRAHFDDALGTLHLGTLAQANMRSAGRYLHLVAVDVERLGRTRDRGADNRKALERARRAGKSAIVYLNRYEGVDRSELNDALDSGADLDAMTDAQFRKVIPSASESLVLLHPGDARVVACFSGLEAAREGWSQHRILGDVPGRKRKPAPMLPLEKWVGIQNPVVISPETFTNREKRLIEACDDRLIVSHARMPGRDADAPDIRGLRYREVMRDEGMRLVEAPNALLALDEATDDLLGGAIGGMIFTRPEHRGRGVATMVHVCAEETRCYGFLPSHFSTGGMAARCSAHRKLCERALERGDPVLARNLETYGLQPAEVEDARACAP